MPVQNVYPRIFLIGLMGSGKSYWGRQLAAHLRLPFLDLDKGIEMAERCTIAELFTQKGENYFREAERDVLQVLMQHPKFVMSCGGGTPCFYDNMEQMKKHGTVIWLHPSNEMLATRLMSGRQKRPLLRNAETETDIIQILISQMEKRMPFYQQANAVITEDHPTLETFENILQYA